MLDTLGQRCEVGGAVIPRAAIVSMLFLALAAVLIAAGALISFGGLVPSGSSDETSIQRCLQAPGRSMMLATLQPIDRNGAMWICGTRLGDERQMPGFFCYRMEECEVSK
jgi:hypothetical protein